MTGATYTHRRIFKSVVTSRNVIQELITMMMVAELVDPGPAGVWIVSPWITDVPLIDNRAGSYNAINPEWGRRVIRLADLAAQLMAGGTSVRIVTRPDNRNQTFLRRLEEIACSAGTMSLLLTARRDTLHTKGILTRRGLMLGSMNLTYNGLVLLDEVIEYDTDPRALADARLAFQGYMGDLA
jgi:hypothetical protein